MEALSVSKHLKILFPLILAIQISYCQEFIEKPKSPISIHSPNSSSSLNVKPMAFEPPQYSADSKPSPYFGDLPYPMMVQNQEPYSNQPQPELINLGVQSSSAAPCATILATSNCILTVPDDGLHKDIELRRFVFAAGVIRDQCLLTVKDCAGTYTTTSTYLISPPSQCNTVSSVCCECSGCSRTNFPLYDNSCAILFENIQCSMCTGFRLEVAVGDQVSRMNELVDNKISSIYVLPGCELIIYSAPNFMGAGALAQGSLDYLPPEWDNEMSSYSCSCPSPGNGPSSPGPSTFSPSLPPVFTTQPVLTTSAQTTQPLTSPMLTTAKYTTMTPEETTTEKLVIISSTGGSTDPSTSPIITSTPAPMTPGTTEDENVVY